MATPPPYDRGCREMIVLLRLLLALAVYRLVLAVAGVV